MKSQSTFLTAIGLATAMYAFAQEPSPMPANSPAALENARIDVDAALEGSVVMRPRSDRDRRIAVNTGDVPNIYTAPPSNDRVHTERTRTESSWTTPQRGTSATGLWPMPGTSGQPGTLQ
jgi:hypothetical protein